MGRGGVELPATSLVVTSGRATLTVAETQRRPSVLGLIAVGRMRPDAGSVTIDGAADARALRRRMALVDAPAVNEPEPNVTLGAVVQEELMFAGLPAGPHHARTRLAAWGAEDVVHTPIRLIQPTLRVRVLCELALLRSGIEGIALIKPDRHGGDPEAWWRVAEEIADRGIAVLVVCGHAAGILLDAEEVDHDSPGRHAETEPPEHVGKHAAADAEPEEGAR